MKKTLLILSLAIFIAACQKQSTESIDVPDINYPATSSDIITGQLRVKLTSVPQDSSELYSLLDGAIITSVHPTFPSDPRFVKRHHDFGLDLWYDICFEKNHSLTKAADAILADDRVEKIEFIRPIKPLSLPFNDPLLSNQWHYHNDGTLSGSVAGCDIDLFDAWAITTGSPDVIVAVIDHGVMYNHEDLASNMWINSAEMNGTPGVDDDQNGYVDDIYGYNFVVGTTTQMKGTITPGDHGTHVAGTIAAVNDNGLGLCGIAGGTSTKPGCRIMSCQTLDDSQSGSYIGAAFVYAADNGAVIAQNSWGIGERVESLEDAIDYFITYAGIDENGDQTGPMKGGLVTFSSGNDNITVGYPAMYENVMAVAALASDYTKAYYSNYGDWVDISAPGGDAYKEHWIWSTVLDNSYQGYAWQGTSMACPHVSGVAALVVSACGGPGFTCDMLWEILINNTKDISSYDPSVSGLIGAGMVDAYKCLAACGTEPPAVVDMILTSAQSNNITLKWKVPSDPDSKKASFFDLYYSDRDISDLQTSSVPEDVEVIRLSSAGLDAGDEFSTVISDLDFETNYYFRVMSLDAGGSASPLSDQYIQNTLSNSNPVIECMDGTQITLKVHETKQMKFRISDPDGHRIAYSVQAGKSVSAVLDEDIVTLTFVGNKENAGTYQAVFKVTDMYDAESSVTVSYTIQPNSSPVVKSAPENMVFGKTGEVSTLKLSDIFNDPDGEAETLNYSVKVSSDGKLVVKAKIEGDVLSLDSKSLGYADIKITCSDIMDASATASFRVLVRDGSVAVDAYPNPVEDYLNLRTGKNTRMDVSIYSSYGGKVYDSTLDSDPFNPAKVDMTLMSGGVYLVKVTENGKTTSMNVVKL